MISIYTERYILSTYLPNNMRSILKILFLIFTIFSAVHAYYDINLCPTSTCGSLSMNYPFKLPNLQPQDDCSYIDLTCNSSNQTTLYLPHAGDFYVRDIAYYNSEIQLYDPGNCLMGRLMKNNLSLSSSPFRAGSYENYTYYTCPSDARIGDIFGIIVSPIDCLSNSTKSTFVSIFMISERMVFYGCEVIGSWLLPVYYFHDIGNNGSLYLTWDSTTCVACDDKGTNGEEDESSSTENLASPFLVPSFIMMATLFIVCLIHIIRTRRNNIDPNSSTVEIALPVTFTAPPPPPAAVGLDESKINSFTELVVLSESRVNQGPDSNTCSICLEIYHPQQLVRSIVKCEHCFHAYCIEQWLSKQKTCPVCRTVLSDIDL